MKKDILFFIYQFLLLSIFLMNVEVKRIAFTIPEILKYILIVIILIGAIVILLGIFALSKPNSFFPSNTSINRQAMFNLGIYKYIRNPIYSGVFVVLIASSIIMGSGLNSIVTLLLGVSFYLKSRIEDERLIKEYSNYNKYKKQVGRFFPKFRKK